MMAVLSRGPIRGRQYQLLLSDTSVPFQEMLPVENKEIKTDAPSFS